MLNSINDSMSSAGGSVKLQRKGADGIMLDSTQAELNLLDSQARIKTAARVLTTLNPAQKLVWATAKKSEGNARYKSGDHDGAIELYLQALAGLVIATSHCFVVASWWSFDTMPRDSSAKTARQRVPLLGFMMVLMALRSLESAPLLSMEPSLMRVMTALGTSVSAALGGGLVYALLHSLFSAGGATPRPTAHSDAR